MNPPPENMSRLFGALMVMMSLLGANLLFSSPEAALSASTECEPLGWFPTDFNLQDHTVFRFDGYYYLASIYRVPDDWFAYARSTDLCNWEDLTPLLEERIEGTWDEAAIWAPFVYEESGTYYMYYTGITHEMTQSILLATTDNPADPDAWVRQGMVFQPNHPGMVWESGGWADCRDPMVVKIDDQYLMYYTGLDEINPGEGRGIIGLATSTSPSGPWVDQGAITEPDDPGVMPESPYLVPYGGFYYLFTARSYIDEFFYIGTSPQGPWEGYYLFEPGWANEFWTDINGQWRTSHVYNRKIKISNLTWDDHQTPPWPYGGDSLHHIFTPYVHH